MNLTTGKRGLVTSYSLKKRKSCIRGGNYGTSIIVGVIQVQVVGVALEADGRGRRDVDKESLFFGGVEGHAELSSDFGKGKNVGDGRRIEPDGKRDEKHAENAFRVGLDRATAVGTHNKGAGGAGVDVGKQVGVLENPMRRAAVHEDAAGRERADDGGETGATIGALVSVMAVGVASETADGGMKDAVVTGNGRGALGEGVAGGGGAGWRLIVGGRGAGWIVVGWAGGHRFLLVEPGVGVFECVRVAVLLAVVQHVLGAKGFLELAVTAVVGVYNGGDSKELGPDVGRFLGVSVAWSGRIEGRIDNKRKNGLKGAANGAKVVDVLLVGLGAFLGRLEGGGGTAEGGDSRHVLVLCVFEIGDDATDALEEPHAVAGLLLEGVVGAVLNTGLDGWAALAFDGDEEGILGALEFGALSLEFGNLGLAHHCCHFLLCG